MSGMNCKLERLVGFLFPQICLNIELMGWDKARRVEGLMRKYAPESMHHRIENERIHKPNDQAHRPAAIALPNCRGGQYANGKPDPRAANAPADFPAVASVSIPGGEPGYAPCDCSQFQEWLSQQDLWVRVAAHSKIVYQAMYLAYTANVEAEPSRKQTGE